MFPNVNLNYLEKVLYYKLSKIISSETEKLPSHQGFHKLKHFKQNNETYFRYLSTILLFNFIPSNTIKEIHPITTGTIF